MTKNKRDALIVVLVLILLLINSIFNEEITNWAKNKILKRKMTVTNVEGKMVVINSEIDGK